MSLTLGTTKRGHPVRLTDEERSWHVHILGGSGRGKSSLLESMIRSDILAPRRGLCLIDPHGTLAQNVIDWCASRRLNDYRTVHVIDAADLEWSASFNPLRLDGVSEPSVRVDAMVSACAQVWGGEDTTKTPLLRKCLTAVFYTLAVRGLALPDATELISSTDPHRVRRVLTENLPDYVFDNLWQDFNGLRPADFVDQFSSTNSRLNMFLKSAAVRRMLGQTKRSIDLMGVMDKSEILIVNLAAKNKFSRDDARLVGTLLASELFLLSLARDRQLARSRPFTFYIDECANFVTDDVEHMLDETRKFGLHVVLAHQRLSQLRRRSPFIYDAVKDGTHTKVIFGGLADDDAEVMAREVFRSTFNVERPKHSLDKAIVVGEEPYWLESESETESYSINQSFNQNSGTSGGGSGSEGLSQSFDPEIEDPRTTVTSAGTVTSEGWSESSGQGHGSSSGRSHSSARSQTMRPIRVVMPTAVHTLEEELHLAIVRLRGLPKQAAILKRPNRLPVRITPPFIREPLTGTARAGPFIEAVRGDSPFIVPARVAEAEIAERRAALRGRHEPPEGDEQFFIEE